MRQFAKLGRKPKPMAEASAKECPAAVWYLWGYFQEISLGLAINGMVPPVVTWEALTTWCALRRIVLDPWECIALVRLGQLRASILSEKDANAV